MSHRNDELQGLLSEEQKSLEKLRLHVLGLEASAESKGTEIAFTRAAVCQTQLVLCHDICKHALACALALCGSDGVSVTTVL